MNQTQSRQLHGRSRYEYVPHLCRHVRPCKRTLPRNHQHRHYPAPIANATAVLKKIDGYIKEEPSGGMALDQRSLPDTIAPLNISPRDTEAFCCLLIPESFVSSYAAPLVPACMGASAITDRPFPGYRGLFRCIWICPSATRFITGI